MRAKEAGKKMTKRIEVAAAPAPLEEYAQHFDGLFGKSNQREGFRRYVEGLLLPGERHKTLTGLTNTEPVVGAQQPRAQRLQWFLSESDWSEREVQAERLRLLREDPATAPTAQGVLVIDETGDRKDGHSTAHVSRQHLANLGTLGVPYVLALKPSHDWWHPEGVAGSLQDVAHEAGWVSAEQPGKWLRITRTFRDGSKEDWWAVEIVAGPYGPEKTERALVATTDPQTLPDISTWYLVTNLPAPTECPGSEAPFPPASLEEVIRLYGLRMWVEQSYKHVKHALGWSQYQVRSDKAIRRHWQLVWCAFSFCWYHASHPSASVTHEAPSEPEAPLHLNVPAEAAGTGEKNQRGTRNLATSVLASGT